MLVACVVDHMGDQQGAIRFFEEHQADYCILGELTDLAIYLGHRGRLYWDITSIGHSAHTCHRHLAVNAIAKMVPLIEEIEALRYEPELPRWVADPSGASCSRPSAASTAGCRPGGPSMIPDECTIRVDSRPAARSRGRRGSGACSTPRSSEPGARDPEARYELVLADRKNAHLIERDHPLTRQALAEAFRSVTGAEPAYGGGSWLADTASTGHLVPDSHLRPRPGARLHAERVARRRGRPRRGHG